MRKIGIIILVLVFSVSCNMTVKQKSDTEKQNLNQKEKKVKVEQTSVSETGNEITVNLKYGFRLVFSNYEDFETFKIYWDTKIYLDNEIVFIDSLSEYETNDKYPSIRKINNSFEILLNYNDRPSINKLRQLVFTNGKLEKDVFLPYFKMTPRDIDNDGKLELAGILYASEFWGDDTVYMPYNPVLVYELGEIGIVIDSVETEKINLRVYDKFYGYEYNSDISFVRNDNFSKVLKEFE